MAKKKGKKKATRRKTKKKAKKKAPKKSSVSDEAIPMGSHATTLGSSRRSRSSGPSWGDHLKCKTGQTAGVRENVFTPGRRPR